MKISLMKFHANSIKCYTNNVLTTFLDINYLKYYGIGMRVLYYTKAKYLNLLKILKMNEGLTNLEQHDGE